MILEILLPVPVNKTFYYKPTEVFKKENLKKGNLVLVDFRGKKFIGVIWQIKNTIIFKKKIKRIEYFYENINFKKEIIESMDFIAEYTCNSIQSIFKLFISGFPKKKNHKNFEELFDLTNQKFDFNYKKKPCLNNEQAMAIREINNLSEKTHNVVVIDGITNSGKTRVYMHAIVEKIKKNYQCLILVPEKILTTQWVKELTKDFGIKPFIYHSSISQKKRNNIWAGCILGKISIVIGTRSALFLPFKNLGLIVIDEEHDISFKQEEGVVINIRDLAVVRAHNSKCLIILSSATPSLETISNCQKKKYKIVKLEKRVGTSKLPTIEIIDMKKSDLIKNRWISTKLELEIQKTLKEKKQSLIFLNKRGYAPVNICKTCGYSKTCKNCDFSLVLHKNQKNPKLSKLLCHCCNYWEYYENKCYECSSENSLIALGVGIERIYDEIKNIFPDANVALLSSDIVSREKNYENILEKIHDNRIDIIIGTQITSKGHHFPNLKIVGILNIDNMLNTFDLRANERVFQLVTQVAGRAGRNCGDGKVLLQTYQPHHEIFKSLINYNKQEYFNWDLKNRRKNDHPPFTNLISLIIEGEDKMKSKKISNDIVDSINSNFRDINIYGPAMALIFKMKNKYRYRVLIKFKKHYPYIKRLKNFLSYLKEKNSINVYVDVDPQSFF